MKTIVIGSDDVISVHLNNPKTGKGYDLSPYFQAGGDVVCCFQRNDGSSADELSWSASGGNFPGTVFPDGCSGSCGDFHIVTPRQATSGWLANDAANIELVLQDTSGKRKRLNLTGVIALVPDGVVGC